MTNWWRWRPVCRCNFGSPYVVWLCFFVNIEPTYGT